MARRPRKEGTAAATRALPPRKTAPGRPQRSRENAETPRRRAQEVAHRLEQSLPEYRTELEHADALELLVATILAAQCTDERVNRVTKRLFAKYRAPRDYLRVTPAELEQDVHETGFYRQKTRSLRGAMEVLERDFGGRVPGTMAELLTLPGVGRKTANVLLGMCFDTPGIVVDTHVTRVSQRLALTGEQDAGKIEQGLMGLLSAAQWTAFGQRLVLHGRYVCRARQPACAECVLNDLCPAATRLRGA